MVHDHRGVRHGPGKVDELIGLEMELEGVEGQAALAEARDAAAEIRVGIEARLGRARQQPRRGIIEARAGVADAALGLRAVARSLGLDFVPLLEGHFDLVLPRDLRPVGPVGQFLDTLASLPCRRQIAQLPGYATA